MRGFVSGILFVLLLASMFTAIPTQTKATNTETFDGTTSNIYDWTMHGYDTNCTSYSPSSAPNTNAVAWVSALPGGTVWAYPIVGNGRLFIGAGGLLNAYNESTGALLWSYSAPGQPGYPDCTAFGNGMVYFGTGEPGPNGCVYALNETTSAKIWECPTDGYVRSPIVAGDRLYFGVDVSGTETGKIYCINATTGVSIWTYTTQDYGITVAVAYDKVYASCGHWQTSTKAAAYCLDTDGSFIWSFPTDKDLAGSLSVANGRVYFIGSNEYSDCEIFALNATNGNQIWKNSNYPNGNAARAAVAYGKLFVSLGDLGIYALDETDGNEIWAFSLSPGPSGGPVVADNKVFFGAGYPSHTFYAVDEATSAVVWSYELAGSIHSWTSAIANGRVFVADHWDQKLYAFGKAHNISVTDVMPSATIVGKGYPVGVDVTVANRGSFTESFNVTACANTTEIGKKTVNNLDPSADEVLSFTWDTSGCSLGNYTISAYATPVPEETNTEDNAFVNGVVMVMQPIHDVAIIDVTPSRSPVGQGYIESISVTVENQGPFQETFDVTAYANATEIQTKTATNLGPLTNRVLTFEWDTKESPLGTFIIKGVADSVPGEEDIIDNTLTDGTVIIQPISHDIAVISVEPSDIFTGPGNSLEIRVMIENQGTVIETFNLTVFANETMIQTRTLTNMDFGTSQISYFTWNTAGFALGNYTITATASNVTGEVETWDNTCSGGIVSIVTETLLYVYPHITHVHLDGTFTIDVRVVNVVNAHGWEVDLQYDPTILSCLSGHYPGDPLGEASSMGFWWGSPFTGHCTLWQITFQGISEGISSLHFNPMWTELIDPNAMDIPFRAVDGVAIVLQHEIVVTRATPRKSIVGQPYHMRIDVVVENKGYFTETFNVTVYANATAIGTREVTLTSGNSTNITFTWDTNGFAYGNFTISAYAWPVPGEFDALNNNFIDGVVKVTIAGDVTGDYFVNIKDATQVGLYWQQHTSPAPANVDINDDGIINIKDASIVGVNWQKHA